MDQVVAEGGFAIVADFGYTKATGELFAVGGVRPLWIAGPIALAGIALACWRVISAL